MGQAWIHLGMTFFVHILMYASVSDKKVYEPCG